MLKIKVKNQKLRKKHRTFDIDCFVYKAIFKNNNFPVLIRWIAFLKLKTVSKVSNKTGAVNICVESITKKRLNNLTKLSRHIFLKHLRSGVITNVVRSSW